MFAILLVGITVKDLPGKQWRFVQMKVYPMTCQWMGRLLRFRQHEAEVVPSKKQRFRLHGGMVVKVALRWGPVRDSSLVRFRCYCPKILPHCRMEMERDLRWFPVRPKE